MRRVLAFDLGASSGRAILAGYDGNSLVCQEVHRFENCPKEQQGHLRWDFEALMGHIRTGIQKAGDVDSLSFDTWGVDFGLVDERGRLLADPVHYRDARTRGAAEQSAAYLHPDQLYQATGNQIMDINTLFQLQKTDLSGADRLLFMPDLFAQQLCGAAVCERTIASTSQMLDPVERTWSDLVLRTFQIPRSLFAPLTDSASVIGTYQGSKVIAGAGHDTQCAVAAMTDVTGEAAFLSCGTWSLLGCELERPVLTRESRVARLSNELGANGRINYLKNIIGLWLIQESRRQWQREGQLYSYAQLDELADAAPPLRAFIDPDGPEFVAPGNMPERIREFCRRTGQPVPEEAGQVARCIYESLALKYRVALSQISRLTGKRFTALHILGGGANSRLLCQMTADCLGIPVVAGPVEATAMGNIILQLTALGALDGVEEGRRLIESSQAIRRFSPHSSDKWDNAYQRYEELIDT